MIEQLSIPTLVAEIGMAGGVCGLVAMECIAKLRRYTAHFALLVCVVIAFFVYSRANLGAHGRFVHDAFTSFSQLASLFLIGGLMVWSKQQSTEWLVLLLSSLLGMLLVLSSYDFLMLFLASELLSMPLYAMMAMKRHTSQEAALKYIILSALAGVIFLYSVSWLYGLTGSTHYTKISNVMPLIASDTRVTLALVGITGAMAFKCAVVPFHAWVGDVYQGAPVPLLVILAGAPKWAMFMAWMRIITGPFSVLQPHMASIIMGLAVSSMFVGALVALKQKNMKRLLAYSSVGHVGFALLGFVRGDVKSLHASMLYMLLYVFTLTALIAVWHFMEKQCTASRIENPQHTLGRLAHMKKTFASFVFVVLLLSVAGLPPMPGFLAKWMMVKTLIQQQHTSLAVLAVLYSLLSLGYTLNIIRIMYSSHDNDMASNTMKSETPFHRLVLSTVLVVLMAFTLVPRPIMSWITCAVNSLPIVVEVSYTVE